MPERNHWFSFLLAAAVLFAAVAPLSAQTRQLERDRARDQSENRTALVIGNGNYRHVPPLGNPVNDANDMADALESLGFEVVRGTDADRIQMLKLIREFGEKLSRRKGVGLFFYAGHGVEVRGENYLIPVDADITKEIETEYFAIEMNMVLRNMEDAANGFNIVLLDACRNNPFSRGWSRSGDSGGLANVNAPTGTFIAYAAAPGAVASDGAGGRNGVFTGALLKQLHRPNLQLEDVFKATREEVMAATANKQVPWTSSSLTGDFFFKVELKAEAPAGEASADTGSVVVPKSQAEQEREAWGLVRDSSDPADLELFLEEFPSGANSRAAKIRLEELVWRSVKSADDVSRVKAYLERFPNGANVGAARIRLRQLEAALAPPEKPVEKKVQVPAAVESVPLEKVKKNGVGMELVYVPPGEFVMGSNTGRADEKPVRTITFNDGFWMGRYEVTQGQWQAVMGSNPSKFKDCGAECPVEMVSWDDIQQFLEKLNAANDGFIYSLPTEAQWEYAARAGTTSTFAFGDSLGSADANVDGRYPHGSAAKGPWVRETVKVGSYKPNAWGLYDMHGNVAEWVEDIYSANYEGLPTDGSANVSLGYRKYRVDRGGSWLTFARAARSSERGRNLPANRSVATGFRVAARLK